MPDESIFESSGSLFLPSCFSSSEEIVMTHLLSVYLFHNSLLLSNQPLFGVGPSEKVTNLLDEISQRCGWDLLGSKD